MRRLSGRDDFVMGLRMAELDAKPVSMRCKICGGSLANDYFAGACRCENCGNKWNLSDMIPNYKDYQKVIDKLNRAAEALDNADDAAKAGQALLMYKSAAAACMEHSDAVGADLMRLCKEGQDKAVLVKHYTSGKSYMEKDNCRKALAEFDKVKGFRDTDILAEQCREKAAIEKKKHIPYAVVIGMIIPAVLCIVLKEKAGLPIAACIPIFIAFSAGLGFVIYLENVWSVIIEVLAFLAAVPLILFVILAYGFHMAVGAAATIAIGVPVGLLILFAVLSERK